MRSEFAGPSRGRRAVVIGGGISGLVAGFELLRAGWQVAIYEASERWGGKIHSSLVGDRMVDAGPDAFLARVDDATDLCRALNIEQHLRSPVAPVPAYIYSGGTLHPLPAKTFLGVPTDIAELAKGSLISAEAIALASQEPELGPSVTDPDPSVGSICRTRLGEEVTARLIDPLIGGINASDIDRLSLSAAAPQLRKALDEHGSLLRGLGQLLESGRAEARSLGSDSPRPVFYGLPGGIATIVDRLVEELADADLHLGHSIPALAQLDLSAVDGVVLGTPAFSTAKLLAEHCPQAALELRSIGYASVSQVTVELPSDAVHPLLDASGILFPRVDGNLLTACTWLSAKWAHYHRAETVLLRMTSGRYGDDRANNLSDEELVDTLLGELSKVIKIKAPPLSSRVQRWPRAFPQYEPGHRDRVERIRRAVGQLSQPTVTLAGAAYDGIGIPACIRSGRTAAQALISQ